MSHNWLSHVPTQYPGSVSQLRSTQQRFKAGFAFWKRRDSNGLVLSTFNTFRKRGCWQFSRHNSKVVYLHHKPCFQRGTDKKVTKKKSHCLPDRTKLEQPNITVGLLQPADGYRRLIKLADDYRRRFQPWDGDRRWFSLVTVILCYFQSLHSNSGSLPYNKQQLLSHTAAVLWF